MRSPTQTEVFDNYNGQLEWKAAMDLPVTVCVLTKINHRDIRLPSFPESMVISQYLGRGSTSRGRATITSGLTMTVSDPPYLKTDEDKAAVVKGIKTLQAALAHDPQIEWLYPAADQTVEDFVDAVRIV